MRFFKKEMGVSVGGGARPTLTPPPLATLPRAPPALLLTLGPARANEARPARIAGRLRAGRDGGVRAGVAHDEAGLTRRRRRHTRRAVAGRTLEGGGPVSGGGGKG